MAGSTFSFIKDPILKQNLDDSFDHIVTLLSLFLETEEKYNEIAKSSFRKTIIISAASIIEALLFHIIDTELSESDLTVSTWELENKKVLYDIGDSHKIVAGDYRTKVTKIKIEKLNLSQIRDLLKKNNILKEPLYSEIDEVRTLRNSQHIGPDKIVKSFSEKDLENAFSVMSDVKSFVKSRTRI